MFWVSYMTFNIKMQKVQESRSVADFKAFFGKPRYGIGNRRWFFRARETPVWAADATHFCSGVNKKVLFSVLNLGFRRVISFVCVQGGKATQIMF